MDGRRILLTPGATLRFGSLGFVYTGPTESVAGRTFMLTVNNCIKVRLDLQADKSPVVVKGPFFPRVVNPRYRIRGTNV
jgi:hypothetical protein